MNTRFFLVFILICVGGFAQPYADSYPTHIYRSSVVNNSYLGSLANEIGMPTVKESSKNYYFRFWINCTAINLWKSTDSTFHGELVFWAYKIRKERKGNKMFVHTIPLDSISTYNLKRFIDSSQISNVNPMDSVDNWGMGTDGIMYYHELKTTHNYQFKSWWSPKAYPNCKEARMVGHFVDRVEEILELNSLADQFYSDLPKGAYTNFNLFYKRGGKSRR